jgi:hypothetical protein
VHARQRGVAYIVGRVVVSDRTVEPLAAVGPEDIARLHRDVGGNVRVPSVVANVLLILE